MPNNKTQDLEVYYVTFGMGTQLGGHHATYEAYSEEIVAAFCRKHFKGLWSTIYRYPPTASKALREKPEQLFYASPEHVWMKEFLSSRSRLEELQSCPRMRYWLHEWKGSGLEPIRMRIPLATGGATHVGL